MPNAAPETTVAPRAGEVGADLAGHVRAVGRGRARPDHGDGCGELVEPQRPPHPEPERDRRRGPARARSGRGRRAPSGHSASPGTTKRMPSRSARSRSRAGSSSASRAATSREHAADVPLLGQVPVHPAARRARRTSAASRGSPGSPSASERDPGQALASSPTARHPAAAATARLTTPPGSSAASAAARRSAAAARPRAPPRPGWSTPRRSATVQATRCTRVAPRRVSRPAYISVSSSAAAGGLSGQPPAAADRGPGR